MKAPIKILTVLIILLVSFSTARSQFLRFGPKVGLSSAKAIIDETVPDGSFSSGDRKVGFHAGLFTRVTIAGVYLQPEVLFSSVNEQISVVDNNQASQAWNLKYNKIEVPVLLGKTFGKVFHAEVGPVFNYILTNDARDGGILDEVKQNYKQATMGYQVGLGFDISDITIDFRYEGNLSKLGGSINVGNESFNTDLRDNMFIVSLGINLF